MKVKSPVRFLTVGEASLALVGCTWAWFRSIPIVYQLDLRALSEAFLATAGLVAVNFILFRLGKRLNRRLPVFEFLEIELFPLLRAASYRELLVLACMAGLGEELLFRGVVQQEIGLWGASLFFGIPHGPSRSLWPLAVWAVLMGGVLGLLYQATGNLLVPALAHTFYDGAALFYIKRISASVPSEPDRDPFKNNSGDWRNGDEIHKDGGSR